MVEAATEEFLSSVTLGMGYEAVIELAVAVAEKFAFLGSELGAQWYDLCTQLAGIDAEPAELRQSDPEGLRAKAESTVSRSQEPFAKTFEYYMQNVINDSIRMTGDANLKRDYYRGLTPGKWARVPVGKTCAWCLMLASQGAWYVSEESALGKEAGHFHSGCDCKAVYHADPESIKGYSAQLGEYKSMYYDAENTRLANDLGREPYPEELQKRIDEAEKRHEMREEQKQREAEERGEEYEKKPWTVYNEDMVIMREKYGLK